MALGLGSNLGTRIHHLRTAARRLQESLLRHARFSRVYETRPVGNLNQPHFLNACCVGWTRAGPRTLLRALKGLEARAGRDPNGPKLSPRPLDLDILLYANEVVTTPQLTIPHVALPERAFVLTPLAEIAGEWPHPVLGHPIAKLAAELDGGGVAVTAHRLPEMSGANS